MPYIDVRTSVSIDEKAEKILKEEFGKAIEIIPGKSENWLMVNLEGGKSMYFRGTEGAAMIDVHVFGKAKAADYGKLTEKLTAIVCKTLGIGKDRIYVKYSEYQYWGYNGLNF